MLTDFFYLAYWKQQLIILLLTIFICVLCYVFFVHDLKSFAADAEKKYLSQLETITASNHQLDQDNIKTIDTQHAQSPNQFNTLFVNNNLRLHKFDQQESLGSIAWTITVHGFFSDFVYALGRINELYPQLYVKSLSIVKIDKQQLAFTFMLTSE